MREFLVSSLLTFSVNSLFSLILFLLFFLYILFSLFKCISKIFLSSNSSVNSLIFLRCSSLSSSFVSLVNECDEVAPTQHFQSINPSPEVPDRFLFAFFQIFHQFILKWEEVQQFSLQCHFPYYLFLLWFSS